MTPTSVDKANPFYKYRNGREYRRAYAEETRRIDMAVQISEARKRKRLSQATLARRAKMPQSQIARIEGGAHNVTVDTLIRVASALNLKVRLV